MVNAQMPFSLAMDLAGTGTLVDVTSWVRGELGVQKTATRTDQFRDAAAATFTFTLDNYDGRFTPGNTSSPYAVTPTERMNVCWSSSSLTGVVTLREGAILTITPNDDNWNLITFVCDDMLGAASRNTLQNLAYSQRVGSGAYGFWPLNDLAGSGTLAEITGNALPMSGSGQVSGIAAVPAVGDSQTQFGVAASVASSPLVTSGFLSGVAYIGTLGYLGAWFTVNQLTAAGTVQTSVSMLSNSALAPFSMTVNYNSGSPIVSANFTGGSAASFPITVGVPVYCVAQFVSTISTMVVNLFMNGVQVATASVASAGVNPPNVLGLRAAITSTLQGTDTVNVSHLSFSPTLVHEEWAGYTTETNRFTAMAQATPQLTLATLPTDLSSAPVGYAATSGQSSLDALNGLVKTEQGYIDCVTTGTATAPTQQVRIRARQRPTTVSYSFDVQQEINAPNGGTPIQFVRDSTNLIWSDVVTGANSTTQTVSQTALQARAGSNNASDTVALYQTSDLYEWGTDRLWRGANVALRPVSVQIDNLRLSTDRSADLNAMVPGDRISFTNIPSTVLGFTSFDGWLLDKDEDHKAGPNASDQFTLYLQPCQPTTAIWDTDLWENGGTLTLSTALTNSATSAIFVSADGVTFFEQTSTGYYIQIDNEVMKVTAAAAPSGTNQTLTVTRAQNSTTAAAHAIGAAPEVVDNSSDVANNGIFAF